MRTIPYLNRNQFENEQEFKLAETIIKNINSGLRMQTVYKEMNSYWYGKKLIDNLIKHLINQGLNILLYSKSIQENGEKISFKEQTQLYVCSEKTIGKQITNSYDIVFIDAPVSGFDMQFIEKDTPYGTYQNLRLFIQAVSENKNTYIINFEKNSSIKEWIMDIPIIATTEMLTTENCKKIYSEYEEGCKNVVFNLRQCQLKLENEKRVSVVEKYSDIQLENKIFEQADGEIYDDELAEDFGHLDMAMSAIMDKLVKVQELVNSLTVEVGKIRREIEKINEYFGKSREILEIYGSVYEKGNLESDLFIKKIIDYTIKSQANDLERTKEYDGYLFAKESLKESMGEDVWNKLQEDSKHLLTTAKVYLNELGTYGTNIDYSSVCMLVSKVYEIELAIRILDGYVSYLKQIGMRKATFPSALIVNRQGKSTVLKREDFTLGNCAYIMGQIGANNIEIEKNKNLFFQYCQEKLSVESGVTKIKKWIRKIDAEIRYVNNTYRKPAAHKGTVSMDEACECIGYFCDTDFTRGELVLTKFLEACNF